MFRFNFTEDVEDKPLSSTDNITANFMGDEIKKNDTFNDTFVEHQFNDLLQTLPSDISYSSLTITSASGAPIVLHRRDLFDARLQLISEDGVDENDGNSKENTLKFADNPSDLVPGVYEGGLKTWECSMDLVAHLQEAVTNHAGLSGKHILELGCGTSLPSIYVLGKLFGSSAHEDKPTVLYLQDYNELVLRLVTLPNIILAWYFSIASKEYRSSLPPSDAADLSDEGDLILDDALLSAFKSSLKSQNIHIRFFSGSWANFAPKNGPREYDMILTSETVYQTENFPSLIKLLRQSHQAKLPDITDVMPKLSLSEAFITEEAPIVLVAAKVLYFGVGGGVDDFIRAVEGQGGTVEMVRDITEGVRRRILQVRFAGRGQGQKMDQPLEMVIPEGQSCANGTCG